MQTERSISRRNMLFGSICSTDRTRLLVADHCLSLTGVACRACEDACAVRAISFQPRMGGAYQLSVDPLACTGCGDCLPVCPVSALELMEKRSHG
jgi:ferredoxin-type protein NapF